MANKAKSGSDKKKTTGIDLGALFSSVAKNVGAQRTTLNQADPYNHNHGDNMAQIFQTIAQAMKEKPNATPSQQLAYASQMLSGMSSGSAQMYAQGLSQASNEFKGQKSVNSDNVLSMIQAMLGGGQASTAQTKGSGDLLGSLLGAAAGSSSQASGSGDLLGSLLGAAAGSSSQSSSGADLLGSLLGAGTARPTQQSQGSGLDMGDLLNAGMAYMNTTSRGGTPLEGLVNALVSSSALGNSSPARNQSSSIVVNSLLSALGGMLRK